MEEELEASKEMINHFRVYTTLLEIIQERGYYIPDARKFASVKEFEISYLEVERLVFYMDDETEEKSALGLHCNFTGSKIEETLVSKFLEIFKPVPQTLIMIASSTQETEKQIQHRFYEQEGVRIEIFKEDELLFNVLKHDLVPKHILLKESEKQDILSYQQVCIYSSKVKESQLPKILLNDPVSRFLGLRKGQVVKIIRKSETAGLYTTYRVAV